MNKNEMLEISSIIEDLETAQNSVYLSVAKDNMMKSVRGRLLTLVDADQRRRSDDQRAIDDQLMDMERDQEMDNHYESMAELSEY